MPWISGNYWLNQSQMENNAKLVHRFFIQRGWTLEAISGMLGNMESESSINPGIWYGLVVGSRSYGLVQWDPYTKYSNWAGENWQDNGPLECQRIIYEMENGLQWIQTSKYPFAFKDFVKATNTPEYLAQVWLYNYERPADLDQPQRSTQARAWYNFLSGEPGGTLPAWLLFKFTGRGLK